MALSKVKEIVSSSPVIVFSKTYCGYCKKVKQLLSEIRATYKVVELDDQSDGDEMQKALEEWTGLKTIPNVFIGGNHMVGYDALLGKHKAGVLVPLLSEVGALKRSSVHVC